MDKPRWYVGIGGWRKMLLIILSTLLLRWSEAANYTLLDANKRTEVLVRYQVRMDGHMVYRAGNLSGYAFQ